MANLENNAIVKKIEINKNHIDHFVMETEEGTKKTKEKFYRNAVDERNRYINGQHVIFDKYKVLLENEMVDRFKRIMPVDKNDLYAKDLLKEEQLLELVKLNTNLSDSFKLNLDFIISSINENTSLEDLNVLLGKFVNSMKDYGIVLGVEDFKYTMFTEKYMSTYFQHFNSEELREAFDKIYFTCPDIMLQLKMNLSYIVDKYKDSLKKYVLSLQEKKFQEEDVTSSNVIVKYTTFRNDIGSRIATDEYNNTKVFLDGQKKIGDYLENSVNRVKTYDMFAVGGNYNALSDEEKISYNSAMMSFYLTLNELKKYYQYEFIVKDLLDKYKGKDSAKSQYLSKKKEIEKEEKNRLGIYKEYMKANGVGFFAKYDETKIKNSMLKMNEHIKKLHDLYVELGDLEISYRLTELSESASIYDLLLKSLSSFSFMEKCFLREEFENKSLEENIHDFFRFLYNPNNTILRKVNVFTDFDIVEIVAEKYRLLKLNVTSDMIGPDTVDSTLESVKVVNFIQNVERSSIDLNTISNICRMNEIVSTKPVDIV